MTVSVRESSSELQLSAPESAPDPDLERVLERARIELSPEELHRAVKRAQVVGEAASSRALRRWLIGLGVVSLGAAALLADAWFLVACLCLGALYGLPVYLAASSTARRDGEQRAITRRLARHGLGQPLESDDQAVFAGVLAERETGPAERWEGEGGATRAPAP